MKKLLLATAIAVSASAAYSQPTNYTVTSAIADVDIYVDIYNLVVPCPSPTNPLLNLTGTASDTDNDGKIETSNLELDGVVCMLANGNGVRLTFDLEAGTYDRDDPGTTFTDGTIDVEVDSGSGFYYYYTIDASVDNIECIADRTGHMSTAFTAPDDTQVTAGLLLNNRFANAITTRNFPGPWTEAPAGEGVPDAPGYNDAVCVTTLLGNRAGLYLTGEVTLTRNP